MSTYSLVRVQNESFLSRIIATQEEFRIQTHLKRVELILRSKDVSHLSKDLQIARKKNLDSLNRYWKSGNFPNNNLFKERTPFFVDRFGTPCAMAYIISESGHPDLVTDVAKINNFVYINDISEGPVLEWIKQSGLTQAEAALIQPSYEMMASCDLDAWKYLGDTICQPKLSSIVFYYLPTLITLAVSCVITWGLYKLALWSNHESKLQRYISNLVHYGLFILFWGILSATIIRLAGIGYGRQDVLIDNINILLSGSFIILTSGCLAAGLFILPKFMLHSNNIFKRRYAFLCYFIISFTICLPLLYVLTSGTPSISPLHL